MSYLLIRHKVRDVEAWKAVFDAYEEVRARAGMRTRFLFRNIDDPNEIIVLFETSDPAKVHAYAASAGLKDAMQRGGVIDEPDFYFLE